MKEIFKIVSTILLVTLTSASRSQTTETLNYPDGSVYVGEVQNGKRHGQGTLTWPDGRGYVGEWLQDHLGQGTMTWPDGTKYVGEFKDDMQSGQAIMTFPEGIIYVGEFLQGKKNGQGTMTWPEGAKYVGEFKDDRFGGQAIMTFPDGRIYVGEFLQDKRNGQGTMTWPNGAKYIGEWKDSLFDGVGTLTEADGRIYVGEFLQDKKNGQGTMTYLDGGEYIGEWKDNAWDGQGTYTHPDGSTHVGEFLQGQISQGVLTFPDGSTVEYLNGAAITAGAALVAQTDDLEQGSRSSESGQSNWRVSREFTSGNLLRNIRAENESTDGRGEKAVMSISCEIDRAGLRPDRDLSFKVSTFDYNFNADGDYYASFQVEFVLAQNVSERYFQSSFSGREIYFSGVSSPWGEPPDWDFIDSMSDLTISDNDDLLELAANSGIDMDQYFPLRDLVEGAKRSLGYGIFDDDLTELWILYKIQNGAEDLTIKTFDSEGKQFDFTWDLAGFGEIADEIQSICPQLSFDDIKL